MEKIDFKKYTVAELRLFKKEIGKILSDQCINGHKEKETRRKSMINDIEQGVSCEDMANKYNRSLETINYDIDCLLRYIIVYLKSELYNKRLTKEEKREIIIQEKQWLTETLNRIYETR